VEWQFTDDPELYADAVLPLLLADPVRNTVGLTVLDAIRHGQRWGPAPFILGWLDDSGRTVGAASITPPFGILLTRVPLAAVAALVAGLRRLDAPVPTANGDRATVERFAAEWGTGAEVTVEHRLFVLGTLLPPEPAPTGRARMAGPQELDLLRRWVSDFQAEVEADAPAPPAEMIRYRLERGLFWLWLDGDGEPVSLAGRTVTVGGVSRVGPVYTPPTQRGHGYAAAVTAQCSQHALDTDADQVILFTDLANPTSNGIYQRLGYRPVEDRVVVRLG